MAFFIIAYIIPFMFTSYLFKSEAKQLIYTGLSNFEVFPLSRFFMKVVSYHGKTYCFLYFRTAYQLSLFVASRVVNLALEISSAIAEDS